MLGFAQKLVLFISFLPYMSLAAYDGWLHEKSRKVPMLEQCFHALVAIALIVLVWSLFSHHPAFAIPALCIFAIAALVDEIGFHKMLENRERRLHHMAYACFAIFVATAFFLKAFQ